VPDLHRISPTASHALSNRVRNFEEEKTPHMLQASSSRGKLVWKGTHLNQIIVEGRILDDVTIVFDETRYQHIQRILDLTRLLL
jgi:hypothetical protein